MHKYSLKVSVIIPTYNRAKLLERAVTSVLAQTMGELEILVCDDGSTDQSQDRMCSVQDKRLRWLPGERSTRPAVPRNRGLQAAKGEWIAFLDSDDQWLPEKLEKQLALAEATSCRAIASNAIRFIPKSGHMGNYFSFERKLFNFNDLLYQNYIICSSAVIHASLIPIIQGFPEIATLKAIEDYALWLRVATQTSFAYLQEPLVIYYDEPDAGVRAGTLPHQLEKTVYQQRQRVFRNFLRWATDHSQCKQTYRLLVKKTSRQDFQKYQFGRFMRLRRRIKKG